MANHTKTTQDHEEIRQWAEARGGKPSHVKSTESSDDIGILRIDFPGFGGEGSLEEISWDEFFEKFDAQGLALIYQEETAEGEKSNFNKLVKEETAAASGSLTKSAKKAPAKKTPAKKSAPVAKKAAAVKKAAPAAKKTAPASKTPAKKAAAKKAPAKKVAAKKVVAKKAVSKKAPAKKVPAKKVVAKKIPAKKAVAKKAPAKKAPAKKVARSRR